MTSAEETMISQTERLGKDLRLDRFVTWFLMVAVGLGISIAAYTYRDLSSKMEKFSDSVNGLSVSVALIQQREERVTEIKSAYATLQAEQIIIRRELQELQIWRASQERSGR